MNWIKDIIYNINNEINGNKINNNTMLVNNRSNNVPGKYDREGWKALRDMGVDIEASFVGKDYWAKCEKGNACFEHKANDVEFRLRI